MTVTVSRTIRSNQQGPHRQLEQVVRRHLQSRFQRPFSAHSLRAFERLNTVVAAHSGPLIVDSFCGVGESTARLAQRFPEALVIGIDKSAHRLNKHGDAYTIAGVDNYQLAQADVHDLWRLAAEAGWQLQRHFLLYPNPWPKAAHLQRRCHGSALFPSLLQLGGNIELRSNWPIYVEEFCRALAVAGYTAAAERYQALPAITPFERKYRDSGHTLWRCVCPLIKRYNAPITIGRL